MKTLVFIALQLSQPRCIKRIETFHKAGFPIKVYGFDSGLYSSTLSKLTFEVEEIITRDKNIGKFQKIKFFLSTIKRIIFINLYYILRNFNILRTLAHCFFNIVIKSRL